MGVRLDLVPGALRAGPAWHKAEQVLRVAEQEQRQRMEADQKKAVEEDQEQEVYSRVVVVV